MNPKIPMMQQKMKTETALLQTPETISLQTAIMMKLKL